MTMRMFRITRVRTGHSPVGRLDGVDDDGLEIHLEVPVAATAGVAPGHVLTLDWSIRAPEQNVVPLPTVPATDVDAQFMALSTRHCASPDPTTTSSAGQQLAAALNLKLS